MSDAFIILGAGRGAREIYWVLQDARPGASVVFVDDVSDTREVMVGGRTLPAIKDWGFSEAGSRCGHSEHRFEHFVGGRREHRCSHGRI